MAFTRFTGFSVDWTTKTTKISGQASNFKTWLNARTSDLLTWLESTFLAELESTTDGASGADKVGMTKLANYGSAASATIQAQAEALDAAIKANIASDASETVKGIVELATAAETTTGTDDTRAVHPKGLKVELDKKALASDLSTHLADEANQLFMNIREVRYIG